MPDDSHQSGDAGTTNGQGDAPGSGDAATFESFYSQQPDSVKALIDGHVSGLKSAHERTKTERNQLRTDLEEIRKSKTLDAEAKLQAYEEKLGAAEQRAAFYESLPGGVRNPKAAYLLAREYGHIRKDGTLDVEKFQEAFPEQFETRAAPSGNAGAGTGAPPPSRKANMNAWIRQQAAGA